mgnify:CR=1 FL=1
MEQSAAGRKTDAFIDLIQDLIDPGRENMDEEKIEKLYELLERAELEEDEDAAAALRWAIFNLED